MNWHVLKFASTRPLAIALGLTFGIALTVLATAGPAKAWRSNFGSKSQFPCAVDPASCMPPSSSSSGSSSGEYSEPRGDGWFCRAESRSGAWGWGEKSTQGAAQSRALERCREFSRGQRCTLRYCKYGGGNATTAGPGRSPGYGAEPAQRRESQPAPAFRPFVLPNAQRQPAPERRRAVVDCSHCETLMRNTIRARLGFVNTFLLPQTVRQAQASFVNCERKTPERTCFSGRILVRSLNRSCSGFLQPFNPPAYERCIATNVP